MFEKKITFKCREEYLATNPPKPEIAKLNIPDWYKDLEHSVTSRTVKGCMPFLDSLTTGYILKTPVELYLKHNYYEENTRKTDLVSGTNPVNVIAQTQNINLVSKPETHIVKQLGSKCPIVHKNKDLPVQKILNPYTITTPPGYSCLFVPPLNNSDDRFSIIPAIVDTDNFPSEINFPIVINGDKYPILDTLIKIGTPYVQIIPFKRDNWKMNIETETQEENDLIRFKQEKFVLNNYKQRWWVKKRWK